MLYRKYLKNQFLSAAQYKLNTFLTAFAQVIINIGEILAVWMLFSRFEKVGEWGFYQALLMMGVIFTAFSINECFARGYDEFSKLIRTGQLDRMLIRPVNIHYQIFGSKIEFSKILRIVLGITVSIIALINLNADWNFYKVLVLIAMYASAVCVVFGLFVIGATISIYTIQKYEFLNIITDGTKEVAYYPINIYSKWLRGIFTFVIPVASFNYLPLSFIMGTGSIPQWLCSISPIFGMLFVIPCIIVFNISLKKYQGTGT